MKKFILIANKQDDIQFQYADFLYNDNTEMLLFRYDKARLRLLKIIDLLGIKNSRAIFHLYFRGIFNNTINKKLDYRKDDEYTFIIMARVYEKYGNTLISHLRRCYPSCVLVIYIVDVLANMGFSLCEAKRQFDVVCSFDEVEAKNNGMCFVLEPFSTRYLKNVKIPQKKQYDVSFVGAAKGRYGKIMWLYNHLRNKGLKCDFYIVGVNKKDQIKSDGLHYEWLNFERVLEHAAHSKCVVEIMQKGGYSATTRFAEAVLLNINLITDCPALKDVEDSSIIWFNEGVELSVDRICNENNTILDKYSEMFSIDTFIETIKSHIQRLYN